MAIYEALFTPISNDLSVQSAIAAVPLLAVCRQICSEATPLLRQYVELRASNLEESVEAHDFSMKAASDLSEYATNAIKAGRFRSELRRFLVLSHTLRRTEELVRAWE
jgi:hypothetical protein